MNVPLRVVIADDEPLLIEEIELYLQDMGHDVVATAHDGEELVTKCAELEPDLVITDIKMPIMDGLAAAKKIYANKPVPFVVVTAYHDTEFIDRAGDSCVMSYLVKPIDEGSLTASVALAVRRFREMHVLDEENVRLRQVIEDRKLIERAKGIVMKRAQIDEEASFRRLQQLARQKSCKMSEIAKSILDAEEAFEL